MMVRLVRLEVLADAVVQRLDRLEGRMDRLEVRMDGIDTRLRGVETAIVKLDERVSHLPTKGSLTLSVMAILGGMAALIAFAERIQAFLGS